MNVPLTPAGLGVETGAGVDFGVVAGVDFGVVAGVDFGVVVRTLLAFFFFVRAFVAAGFGVLAGAFVAVVALMGVELGAGAAGAVVGPTASEDPLPSEVDPAPSAKAVVDPNCGGVIDRTAPRPVTVPPAIKKKRLLIIVASLNQSHEI